MKHKAILYMIIVILLSSVIKAEKYFVLDINYIYGSIAFNKISLREIDRLIAQNHDSGFNIRLISFQDKEIYSFYYNFSDNDNYLIYIPYNENAFRIEVTNPQNSKVMDIDVSYFSNLCGNNICDMHESYESCKKDCQSGGKDDFCDSVNDNTCDPDCSSKTDSDCIEIPERLNETSLSTTSKIEEKEEYKESIQEKR
ncbi:hypothetical protein HYW99_00895, partial [Candidatus Woesearchaeota archaeon]|nr:hypothetical protein [Candidatus Woesearchaeota archaeon]